MTAVLDRARIRRALAGPWPDAPRPVWTLVCYLASGVALGVAHVHPRFAAAAWVSAICVALALLWSRRVAAVFGGLCVQQLAAILIGFDWIAAMNAVVFDFTDAEALGFFALAMIAGTVPFAVVVTAPYAAFRRRLALLWWLPSAYVLGEALRFEVTIVALCDWMLSQWQVEPMLRAVGHLGWWGAHVVTLGAACAIATALAARALRPAWPALAGLGLLALPPLPTDGVELLEGVAVVHTDSTVDLPHRLPPAEGGPPVELLIWPEAAFELQPRLVEGRTPGARLRPLMHGVDVTHLVGLETVWPRRQPQNQAVVVTATGEVGAARAKSRLMPVAEGRVLGLAEDRYLRGKAPPVLEAAGRVVIPLICGEFMSRLLVADGVEAGGELLVALARDQMMLTQRARRQLLAAQVMRSVEFGVPSVRASYGGEANVVGPDGAVLARGALGRNGILRWDRRHGARDADFFGRPIDPEAEPAPPTPDIVALYPRDQPRFRARCPEGRCRHVALEDVAGGRVGIRASTVVVSGHGTHTEWLGLDAGGLAAVIAGFEPELIVVDTCFGASAELLAALRSPGAVVVAASTLLPPQGLDFRPAFFEPGDPMQRAMAVVDPPGTPLLRWPIDPPALTEALARVEAMDGAALAEALASRVPPRVRAPLGVAGPVLAPFDWRRLPAEMPRRGPRITRRSTTPR